MNTRNRRVRDIIKTLGVERWESRFVSARWAEFERCGYFLRIEFIPDHQSVNVMIRNVTTRESVQRHGIRNRDVRALIELWNAQILVEEAHQL